MFRCLGAKTAPLGQYQMDAGGLDAIDGADGAGKFALKRAQMVDVWTKLVVPSASDLSNSRSRRRRLGNPPSAISCAAAMTLSFGTMITAPSLRSSKGIGLAFQVLDDP